MCFIHEFEIPVLLSYCIRLSKKHYQQHLRRGKNNIKNGRWYIPEACKALMFDASNTSAASDCSRFHHSFFLVLQQEKKDSKCILS